MLNTPVKKLSSLTLILLVVALAAYVLTVMKYQAVDPLVNALPYMQTAGAARSLLVLATLVGLVAVVLKEYGDEIGPLTQIWLVRGWQALIGVVLLAVVLNIMESRTWLELPLVLDVTVLSLSAVTFWSMRGRLLANKLLIGWLVMIGMCLVAGWLLPAHPMEDIALQVIAGGLLIQMALPVTMMVASGIENEYLVGSMIFGGSLMAASPMIALGWEESTFFRFVIIVLITIVYGFGFFRIIDRSRTALAFFLLQMLLGTLISVPGIMPYLHGTLLVTLQYLLPLTGTLLLIGEKLFPSIQDSVIIKVLLIGGSMVTIGVLLTAGIAQVYLERVFSIGYLDVQNALIPLFAMWIIGAGMLLLGVILTGVLRFIERN
jgi:hypothetical protein